MKKVFTYLLLILLLGNLQANNKKYTQITNSAGLSNSAINCILQDSNKIMWFGTWDGLNRFDGKNFTVFKPEPGNTQTISNNIIRNILEQRKGIIWITTDHGINRMDINKASFSHYYFGYEKVYPASPEIYAVAKTSDNTIFSSVTGWGLSFYNEPSDEFQAINTPFIATQDIKDIKVDPKDRIWVLHKNGTIDIVEWEKNKKGDISISRTSNIDIPSIMAIYTGGHYIALLDMSQKLHVYDTNIENKIYEYDLKKILPASNITMVNILGETLYISPSTGGYYTLTIPTQSEPVFALDMKDIVVRYIYKCNQDITWAGTDGKGIFTIYDKNMIFNTVKVRDDLNSVRSFCEDNQKRVWVATKGGGIFVLEGDNIPDYRVTAEYTTNNGLLHNSVYVIKKGFGGDLFIGSDGKGLNIFSNNHLSTLNLENLPKGRLYQNEITSIYAIYCSEKDSTLWLGTTGSGLLKIKVKKENNSYKAIEYKQYLHDKNNPKSLANNIIFSIIPDGEKHFWIATRGGGLNYFDIRTEEFKSFQYSTNNPNTISNNDILTLYKEKNGNLWVGTSAGLNLLKEKDKSTGNFIKYTVNDGLPNNTVHGIIEDNTGNIWISTNKGISKINKIDNQITSYYERNGLQNDEFSDGAYYKSEFSDYLFFGGISGFNIFNPSQISLSSYVPDFFISSFKIFNENTGFYNRVEKNSEGQNELVLNYDENFFSFGFLSLDYIQNENCEYKYMLQGVDKDWIQSGNLGNATYTNIKPGNYTLVVYYTNSDKVWVKEPYKLNIIVRPPYWETPLAYCIYFLIFLALAFVSYNIIRRRFAQKRKLLIERLERKEQENIHEAKLRFFTNIAHEFYTPITLIYGPCEKILEKNPQDDYVTKYVKVIQSNAERMKRLIRELMEFRKVDTDHGKITPKKLNVAELLNSICDNFKEIAEDNNIDFKINIGNPTMTWVSDLDSLEKIQFNIVSNAFKYTPQNGYINVQLSSTNDKLTFRVTNSGKGIKPESINEIFDRFKVLDNFENQIEKGNTGRNGIGLALTKALVTLLKGEIKVKSILNEDTTFTIELPVMEEVEEVDSINIVKEETEIVSKPQKMEALRDTIQLPSGEDGSPLILIVDDEKEIRDLIRDTLGKKYSNIVEASNGIEALELMKTKRPNLIICDIMMPEMDGLKFASELKNNIFTNHLPIIFLSAKSSIEDQILAAQSGSDIYITKPFHPKHILAAVESILIKHKLIQEYYNSSANAYDLLENGNMVHKEDKDFMLRLIQFIETNIEDETMSPATISENLGISKMTLYRKIKEIQNQTPSEFIKNIKMNKATYLLLTTNLTIQEIMFKSGFNNKSYFYREFFKLYSLTPKEYREQHGLDEEEIMKSTL